MTFEQFRNNVESWAEVRGIYEHSTALAQALKAVSEVGELADAVIKNDKAALIDAIGDVAVCLVNVARIRGEEISDTSFNLGIPNNPLPEQQAAFIAYHVSDLASDLVHAPELTGEHNTTHAFACMTCLAEYIGSSLDQCCESAWIEIKDRKGRMVAGGAFVKE